MSQPIPALNPWSRTAAVMLSGLARLAGFAALAAPAGALAQAHVHGVARVDIVIDGSQLVVALESPLDSIVGFEHRPRTAAQRQAAEAAVSRLNDGAALWRPDAAARCTLADMSLQADALQPMETVVSGGQSAPTAAGTRQAGKAGSAAHADHADLEARYVFRCAAPERLQALEHGLFAAFKGMQRLDMQIAGPKGQLRATLRRPATKVMLTGR